MLVYEVVVDLVAIDSPLPQPGIDQSLGRLSELTRVEGCEPRQDGGGEEAIRQVAIAVAEAGQP